MVRAVIFDVFGVLITDALEALVADFRRTEPGKAAKIIETITMTNKGLMSPDVSRVTVASLLGITTDEYVQRLRTGEVKNKALFDFVASLRPRYKIGLLSNTSSIGLEVRFTHEELTTYFDVAIASGAIGYAKPEPQAYEITANKLGVKPEECVMVDDRDRYCVGARAVGMEAILYESVGQVEREMAKLGVK